MAEIQNQGEGRELSSDQDQVVDNRDLLERLRYRLRLSVGCKAEIIAQLNSCEIDIANLQYLIAKIEDEIAENL